MSIDCLDAFQTSKPQCKLTLVPAGHFSGIFPNNSVGSKNVDIATNNSAHKLKLTPFTTSFPLK